MWCSANVRMQCQDTGTGNRNRKRKRNGGEKETKIYKKGVGEFIYSGHVAFENLYNKEEKTQNKRNCKLQTAKSETTRFTTRWRIVALVKL